MSRRREQVETKLRHLAYVHVRTNTKGVRFWQHPDADDDIRVPSQVHDELEARRIVAAAEAAIGQRPMIAANKTNVRAVKARRDAETAHRRDACDAKMTYAKNFAESKAHADAMSESLEIAAKMAFWRPRIGEWSLSTHAVARMHQHRVHADDVLAALRSPRDVNLSGKLPTYIGDRCSVVADPQSRSIVTVVSTIRNANVN